MRKIPKVEFPSLKLSYFRGGNPSNYSLHHSFSPSQSLLLQSNCRFSTLPSPFLSSSQNLSFTPSQFPLSVLSPPPSFVLPSSHLSSSSLFPLSQTNTNKHFKRYKHDSAKEPSSQTSNQPDTNETIETIESQKPKTMTIRIQDFIKKYGPIGVVIYLSIYILMLLGWYSAFKSGAVDSQVIFKFLRKHFEWLDFSEYKPKAGAFALAWVLTKILEPLRFAMTVAITPPVLRAFKKLRLK